MNVSGLSITTHHLFMALGHKALGLVPEIEGKIKKKLTVKTEMQFGQIMGLLHPHEMVNVLRLRGQTLEADLIQRWFCVGDYDCSGMLGLIPGSWDIDRVVKYICRHETVDFTWVDHLAHAEGMMKWHGIEVVDFTPYSSPLSDQFNIKMLENLRMALA